MKIQRFEAVLLMGINTIAIFNDLHTISRLFDFELNQKPRFDLIFCGDFLNLQELNKTLLQKYPVAKWPLSWILSDTIDVTLDLRTNNHSTIFFFTPPSEKLLFSLIDKIGSMYSKLNITRGSCHRRIFFLPWPSEREPGMLNVSTWLDNNQDLKEHARVIRQDVEVYIIIWSSDAFGVQIVTDIIEVYGIRSTVTVFQSVQSLEFNGLKNDSAGLQIDTERLLQIATRRNDFHGVLFNVLAQPDEFYKPEVDVQKLKNGSVYFASGSSLQVFYDVMRTLNFTYQPIEGKGWMALVNGSNGETLSGLGQQIMNFEADLSISTCTMEAYRAKFISFLQPIGGEESYVFFRQPSIAAARNIFMMPFKVELWYLILGVWLVVMVCGFLIALRIPKRPGHIGTGRMYFRFQPREGHFLWYDAYIWAIGSACQQGWFGSPAQLPVRILFITGLFSNLVIYAYYTAAFVAAISAPTTLINTYTDLYKNDFQVIANPSNPGYLLSFTETQNEYDELLSISNKLYTDDGAVVNNIMRSSGRIAVIIGQDGFYSVGLENYSVSDLCEIDKKKGKVGPEVKDAMLIRKGSPYKEFFQHSTIMLIERGLAKRSWMTYEINTQIRCLQSPVEAFELDFLDCYTAFMFLFVGQAVACFWALFERQCRRRHGKVYSLFSSWFSAGR